MLFGSGDPTLKLQALAKWDHRTNRREKKQSLYYFILRCVKKPLVALELQTPDSFSVRQFFFFYFIATVKTVKVTCCIFTDTENKHFSLLDHLKTFKTFIASN